MVNQVVNIRDLKQRIGETWTSKWYAIDQQLIDAFADVSGDHAYIHVDPDRARTSRFGSTIAHGLLTLSLLPAFMADAMPRLIGTSMGVNYGFDHVRFLEPIPVGSRIRGWFRLDDIYETKLNFMRLRYDVTIEIDGAEKAAIVARWLIGRWAEDRSAVSVD